MNIYEHHEIKGWFFLPEDKDNPEKWVPGVLKWDPAKGAEIELMGGLFPGFYYKVEQNGKSSPSGEVSGVVIPADDVSAIPAMFLETTKGDRYSIFDAQRGDYSANPFSGRNNREHWHSMQVYVGDHVVPEEKIFTKATFYIDELYYLVNKRQILPPKLCQIEEVERPGETLENGTFLMPYVIPVIGGFQAGIFEGNTRDVHYSINVSTTRPLINALTEGDPESTLKFMLDHQRYGLALTISVVASVSIILQRHEREAEDLAGKASDFVDNFAPIRDLMRLATFQPCGVSSINLEQKKKDSNNDNSLLRDLGFPDDKIGPPPVDRGFMLIKSRFGEIAQPYESHESKKVIFTLNDISLENFLKERERLTSKDGAFDPWVILIGLCGYIPNYMEEYISQSFAAAEGFHKLCLGKDGHLKKRLEDLYSLLPQKIRNQIKFDDNIEIWAELAANVRHRAAHGGPQDGRNNNTISDVIKRYVGTLSISDCNAVAASAHLVTYLVLLNELGVSSEVICNALNMHPKISTMVYYCSKVRPLLESIKNLPTS